MKNLQKQQRSSSRLRTRSGKEKNKGAKVTKEEDENGEEDMDAEDAEGEEESTRSPPKKAKKADVSECDSPRSSRF